MIYGLYLSASGVLASSYRQDVIANNLANSETVGFKKDVALFEQRLTEAQARRLPPGGWLFGGPTNPLLEPIGGGLLAHPTVIDSSQGELEPTGSPLDVAIEGRGYFAVDDKGQTRLTRNGQFAVDRKGRLILSNGEGQAVLDPKGKAIKLLPGLSTAISSDGTITQDGNPVGRIGVFDVADRRQLLKQGGTLMSHPDQSLVPAAGSLRSEFVERANVDPASELAELMETQRQLEANANMIRYQDQTLGRLVNEVGKIG